MSVEWKCPRCGATPDGCGKDTEHLVDGGSCPGGCMGFVCECLDNGIASSDTEEHGGSLADPCTCASCYHCGWGGTFPRPAWTQKDLPDWARTAWKAGWRPPAGWEAAKARSGPKKPKDPKKKKKGVEKG